MKKQNYYVYNPSDGTMGKVISQTDLMCRVNILSARNAELRGKIVTYLRKDVKRVKKKDFEAASVIWD